MTPSGGMGGEARQRRRAAAPPAATPRPVSSGLGAAPSRRGLCHLLRRESSPSRSSPPRAPGSGEPSWWRGVRPCAANRCAAAARGWRWGAAEDSSSKRAAQAAASARPAASGREIAMIVLTATPAAAAICGTAVASSPGAAKAWSSGVEDRLAFAGLDMLEIEMNVHSISRGDAPRPAPSPEPRPADGDNE